MKYPRKHLPPSLPDAIDMPILRTGEMIVDGAIRLRMAASGHESQPSATVPASTNSALQEDAA